MTTEQIANYYKGEAVILGKDAMVFVEGLEDVVFWESVFSKFAPDLKLEFLYETKFSLGKTGLNQALKFKDYLDKRFFICIDSDNSYLLQNSICQNKFVFQTYTYSIENHKCAPINLNRLVKIMTTLESPFDFEVFFEEYGKIVYPLLLHILYFERIKLQQIEEGGQVSGEGLVSKKKLIAAIGVNTAETNIHNMKALLKQIEDRVKALLENIEAKHGQIDLQPFINILNSLKIQATDSFWFINGHIVYSSVVTNLLNKIKSINTKQKKEAIQKIMNEESRENMRKQFDNYRKTMNLHTLLTVNHEKCLAFEGSSPCMNHIEKNIEYFLKKHC